MPRTPALTHLDPAGHPAMVDVSAKETTKREAHARCRVRFPLDVARQLRATGLKSAKGGIVETAIVAGLVVAVRPKFGGYLVAAWLAGIIVNLLLLGDYYDVALRDFGLLIGAVALARLATAFERHPAATAARSVEAA